MKQRLEIAVLAAGQGTRFKSKLAKVLHSAGGRTLIERTVRTALELRPEKIVVVVGHQGDAVINSVRDASLNDVEFVHQREQRGTGHAMRCAEKKLAGAAPRLLVLYADAPLISAKTLRDFTAFQSRTGAAAAVMTAELDDPSGYGRIIRDQNGAGSHAAVAEIVEHKSASREQLAILEINTGIYCFDSEVLFSVLKRVKPDQKTGEYYLTDAIKLLRDIGGRVLAWPVADSSEVVGINNRAELAGVDTLLRARKARELMLAGVTILRPESVVIDPDVKVGADTVLEPQVMLLGKTRIGEDCHVGAGSVISDADIADQVLIRPYCVISESRIARGAAVGPFAHLRPGADIGPDARVGNFVEVKKTRLGRGSKAQHLTYLGDAIVGDEVNIGAGTITCNYDGKNKNQTVIESNVFVGSGTELVAPVRVGRNAYVAAGSTITEDVPGGSLAIARSRQTVKPNWVEKRLRNRKTPKH